MGAGAATGPSKACFPAPALGVIMSKERNRPEAGQVEKDQQDQHPDRSRNAPRSYSRNTDGDSNKLFSKLEIEGRDRRSDLFSILTGETEIVQPDNELDRPSFNPYLIEGY